MYGYSEKLKCIFKVQYLLQFTVPYKIVAYPLINKRFRECNFLGTILSCLSFLFDFYINCRKTD